MKTKHRKPYQINETNYISKQDILVHLTLKVHYTLKVYFEKSKILSKKE